MLEFLGKGECLVTLAELNNTPKKQDFAPRGQLNPIIRFMTILEHVDFGARLGAAKPVCLLLQSSPVGDSQSLALRCPPPPVHVEG